MKRTVGVLVGLLLLVFAAQAHALTLQTSDTSRPWQAWASEAQVPTYGGDLPLTVTPTYFDCGGFTQAEGCTSITPAFDPTTGQFTGGAPSAISTEVDSGPTALEAKASFYHELGQVFWAEYMTPADETAFMQIVGLSGGAADWSNWAYTRVVNGVTITFPPFEWFAEGYRYCAEYGVNQPLGVNDEEGLAYPGREGWFATQQRDVCRLIDTVGERYGISTPAQQSYYSRTRLTGRVISVHIDTHKVSKAETRWSRSDERIGAIIHREDVPRRGADEHGARSTS